MKNYAEMSDYELNFEVARHSFDAGWLERHYGKDGMVPDYCNNWADAGPVIAENRISLLLADDQISFAYSKSVYDEFGCVEGYEFEVEHKNQLRAAMIVFLMMKDNETRILAPDEVSDERMD